MPYTYNNIKSVRVIDGDTVEIEIDLGFHCSYKYPFRLADINAPEGKNTKAAEWLIANLSADKLTVETHTPDKYGRWLADLYMDVGDGKPLHINQVMIVLGLAVPYNGGKR